MLLDLLAFALQVQLLDAPVKEHILVVGFVVKWTDLVDVETDSREGDSRAQLNFCKILIRDIFGGLLFDVGSLRQLESIIKTQLKLPSLLDCLVLLFVSFALLSNNCRSTCNFILGIFVTAVECKH